MAVAGPKKSFWKLIFEYIQVLLGVLLYTLSWTIFLVPHNLVGGGVSGASAIVQYATGIPMGYTYFTINAVLIVVGLYVLGRSFGGKTVFAIIMSSVFLNTLPGIIPHELIEAIALANGKIVCTILGSVLIGLSIGITMSAGGSTGGTDIIALIVNKYRNISLGKMILMIDIVIISSSLLVPSYITDPETGAQTAMGLPDKIVTTIYGFLLVWLTAEVLDFYLAGSKQSVQVMIFSKNYEQLADAINKDLRRGVTMIPAVGWYSKKESNILVVVARKADLNDLLKYIKFIDPKAFVTVGSVQGVYGEGFEMIKMKAEASKKAEA